MPVIPIVMFTLAQDVSVHLTAQQSGGGGSGRVAAVATISQCGAVQCEKCSAEASACVVCVFAHFIKDPVAMLLYCLFEISAVPAFKWRLAKANFHLTPK